MSSGGLLFLLIILACVGAFVFSICTAIAKQFRLHLRRIDCSACGKMVPFASPATSSRQAELGGWTCSGCGAELDEMGVDMSPLIEATRDLENAKFIAALRQEDGTPLEKVIEDKD
jgi:hypothetical protein